MRLVVDLQTSQGISAERGLGRYALELTKALAQAPRGHEVVVAVNEQLPRPPEDIVRALAGSVPADRVRVWRSLPNTKAILPEADWRRTASQRLRWDFLSGLQPDMVLTGSAIEGIGDDVISLPPPSTGAFATAGVFFDAIPLIYPERYLSNPTVDQAIRARYSTFATSDAVLAISASSAREAVDYCGVRPERVTNIMSGVSPDFRPVTLDRAQREQLQQAYGLRDRYDTVRRWGQFAEERSEPCSRLCRTAASSTALPSTCDWESAFLDEMATLKSIAAAGGANPGDLIFTDFIAEVDLPALYSTCSLFVYPSSARGVWSVPCWRRWPAGHRQSEAIGRAFLK